jgi:hypothetical protein
MAVSPVPQRLSQLRLFAHPQCNPHWTDLSSDVQRKIVRLVAQLLRHHRGATEDTELPEEAHGE